MTSFLGRLFRGKEPDLEELRAALDETERRREEKRLALKKLLVRRDHVLAGLKDARRAGDALKVDTLWDSLEEMRADLGNVRREAKVAALESRTLARYVRGMEHLARRDDREGIRRLLGRVRSSALPDLLSRAEIDEEKYLAELDLLVADDAGAEEPAADDPRKEEFLRRLDRIAEAEGAGRAQDARREEEDLRQELDDGTI
jgi:hypothetical protein